MAERISFPIAPHLMFDFVLLYFRKSQPEYSRLINDVYTLS